MYPVKLKCKDVLVMLVHLWIMFKMRVLVSMQLSAPVMILCIRRSMQLVKLSRRIADNGNIVLTVK